VRVAALGTPVQRSAPSSSSARTSPVLRRRIAVGVLVVVSLALVTVYFRESDSGPVHGFQSAVASALRPFEVAAERVARPFRDAAGWFGGLIDAKEENKKLRAENERLRQRDILTEAALRENAQLRDLLNVLEGRRFPSDYRAVAARVISRAPWNFEQKITVAAGKNAGISKNDAVVTADGLVGQVTRVTRDTAQVTLLSDETSAVSALDIRSNASGIVEHGESGDSLFLKRVTKDQIVKKGDVIVTSGWRQGELASLYPRGIPIGIVTSVGQIDTEAYKRVLIDPFPDFSSIEDVLVLVPKKKK
jgi:rod shape-determining protein MreC